MKTLHRRCAGLDVHKDSVVCCFRIVLEGRFQLVLANAAHIRNVPVRETDVLDAQWIADLLAHGLIRSSFVPPTPIQEVRDLTRTRKQLVREVVQHTQRIQKTLETANVKLSSVISDVLGRTGRAVLRAMIEGQQDPERLLELKHPRIQASDEQFVEALRGRVTDHHRFLLRLHLEQIEALEQAIASLDRQIDRSLQPFRAQVDVLTTIPGVDKALAAVILGEIGSDMTRFPTAGHSRETCLRAQDDRLRARRGGKKAIVAVAASMLTSAYHMLSNLSPYHDRGPRHFDSSPRDRQRAATQLVRRLRDLGYQVSLTPAPAA